MFGYIYLSKNTKTGLIYVGQKRSEVFLGNKYVGSGKLLLEALREYGRDSFEVTLLEEVELESQMKGREEYWIGYYNSTDRSIGYNMVKNGQVNRNPGLSGEDNPFFGKHHSEESRKKMSEGQHRRTDYQPHSEETKQKIREKLLGREITWKDKLSANAKINPNYGMRGKKTSEETKEKIRIKTKQYFSDDNHRKELSNIIKNRWQDPEYRAKHIEGMKNGKKRSTSYKQCEKCGRTISANNYSRHVAKCNFVIQEQNNDLSKSKQRQI